MRQQPAIYWPLCTQLGVGLLALQKEADDHTKVETSSRPMYQLSTELGPIDLREDSCPAALSAFQLGSRVAQTISNETTCRLELGSVTFSESWGDVAGGKRGGGGWGVIRW